MGVSGSSPRDSEIGTSAGVNINVSADELRTLQRTTLLDHSSVATLRAVTDATQGLISKGPTTWEDVERLMYLFGNIDILVRDHFPGSRIISDIIEIVTNELHQHGLEKENTLFASSVCPDEINHDESNMTAIFSRYWGQCFQMGGLAGVPFSGQTGFQAFMNHVPDNGNMFILFAPHIGITPDGKFGHYARFGQNREEHGTACGSAVAAYRHIKNGGEVPDFTHLGQYPFDYQQQWIISKLATSLQKINEAKNPMVELSVQMFDIIQDFMFNIISTSSVPGSVALLGGVHINTPDPMEDFFWPICYQIRHKNDPPINLLSSLRKVEEAKHVPISIAVPGPGAVAPPTTASTPTARTMAAEMLVHSLCSVCDATSEGCAPDCPMQRNRANSTAMMMMSMLSFRADDPSGSGDGSLVVPWSIAQTAMTHESPEEGPFGPSSDEDEKK
jgi:hypothetical protein